MDLGDKTLPVTYFQADAFGAGIWGRGGASIGKDGTVYAATGDGSFEPAKGKYGDRSRLRDGQVERHDQPRMVRRPQSGRGLVQRR